MSERTTAEIAAGGPRTGVAEMTTAEIVTAGGEAIQAYADAAVEAARKTWEDEVLRPARRTAYEAGYNAGWNDGVDKEAHDHDASGLRMPPPDYDAALAAALAAAGLARCSVCGDRPCIHDGPKP